MASKIVINKSNIDSLPIPSKNPDGKPTKEDYYDTKLTGFVVRVASSGSKTYYAIGRTGGRMVWVKLGKHGIMTAEDARTEAKKKLGEMAGGKNPNIEKARNRDRGQTLQQVFEDYLTARPKMTERTKSVDRSLLNCHLSDWMKKPILEITDSMVRKRHLQIAKGTGEASANNAIRLFRRIHRFAAKVLKIEGLDRDMVKDTMEKQWFEEKRRATVIKSYDLATWYQAVLKISNPVISDYLTLLLFTGMRESEGQKLKWTDVDFKEKTFTIHNTKNKSSHTLPMSSFIEGILQRRYSNRVGPYVFPGTGKTGHIVEVKRQIEFIERETRKMLNGVDSDEALDKLIAEKKEDAIKPGIKFCLHDLRRGFASIAEQEVSYTMLKRLMNHSTKKDVTQGYIGIEFEKLRQGMQRITDAIEKLIMPPRDNGTKVIDFQEAKVKRSL